jgi:hypothetical protein
MTDTVNSYEVVGSAARKAAKAGANQDLAIFEPSEDESKVEHFAG